MKRRHLFISAMIACTLSISIVFGNPAITQISPHYGSASGGESITITGTGFTGATEIKFGPTSAPIISISDTQITTTAPRSVPGTVHISVTVGADSSPVTPSDRYTYQGSWFAYVTGSRNTALAVWYINHSNPEDMGIINLGDSPTPLGGIAITPDGRAAYMGRDNTNSLGLDSVTRAIDLVTNSSLPVSCGSNLVGETVAISPDGTTVSVPIASSPTPYGEGSLLSIDTTTNQPVGPPVQIQLFEPQVVAITPDGQKTYLSNFRDNKLVVYEGSSPRSIPISITPSSLSISPDGSTVYVSPGFGSSVSAISTSTDDEISIPLPEGVRGFSALSPDGQYLYVPTTRESYLMQINTSTHETKTFYCMPGRVQSVAITPDGKWAYVAQTNYLGRRVAVVDLISETPPPIIQLESADNPQCVAITPDPAPAADFTFTVGAAGSPTIFDASRSVSPVGTIAQYTWSFGDGTTDQSSDTPLVSHVYATVGTYTVELTVTNSAGTSVNKTFTGQMISNNGSSENAQLTQSVVVPPPSPPPTPPLPPSLFCGKIKKHHRISLKMRWNPSPSSNAVGYQICENNRKHTYTTTYETSKLHLKKHLHPKHYYKHHLQDYKKYLQNRYTLRAVNAEGEQSTSIQLHVK